MKTVLAAAGWLLCLFCAIPSAMMLDSGNLPEYIPIWVAVIVGISPLAYPLLYMAIGLAIFCWKETITGVPRDRLEQGEECE